MLEGGRAVLGGSTDTELLVLAMEEEARPSPRSPCSTPPRASSYPEEEDSSTSSSTLLCSNAP